jgi:hypothetical protein
MTADQYFKCNNQPKTDGCDEGEKGKEIQQGGSMGEVLFHHFGGERVWRDVE